MGRVRTTKNRRPVELIYTEEFEDYKEARQRELYLKSGTGREWLQTKLEGGRAVEGDGLENRCRGNSTVSSDLTPSAI